MASLIAAIDEAVSHGDSLIFRKNPHGADACFPECEDISMAIEKFIPGRGSCFYSSIWNMNGVKGRDSVIINGLGALLELLSKGQEGYSKRLMAADEVFSKALSILNGRRKSGGASIRPLDRDSLVRLIDTVFYNEGEQNARSKAATD